MRDDYQTKEWFNLQDHVMERKMNPVLADAIEKALIGGNHLPLLIGVDHPPHTAGADKVLQHYGAGDTYDIWCAWRSLMRLSRIWDSFCEPGQ